MAYSNSTGNVIKIVGQHQEQVTLHFQPVLVLHELQAQSMDRVEGHHELSLEPYEADTQKHEPVDEHDKSAVEADHSATRHGDNTAFLGLKYILFIYQ